MTVEPETLPAAAIGACSHAVHFYDRDDDLADRVVRHLAEGLLAPIAAAGNVSGSTVIYVIASKCRGPA